MMANSLEPTEDEYKQLSLMFRSEGYGIMGRLLDARMSIMIGSMIGSKDDKEVIRIKNEILGMKEAKDLVASIIKEGESKYGNS